MGSVCEDSTNQGGKIFERKQKDGFVCTYSVFLPFPKQFSITTIYYLCSIYFALGINLEIKYMVGYVWSICKCYTILYNKFEHPWILLSEQGSWNQSPMNTKDKCISESMV